LTAYYVYCTLTNRGDSEILQATHWAAICTSLLSLLPSFSLSPLTHTCMHTHTHIHKCEHAHTVFQVLISGTTAIMKVLQEEIIRS